MPPLFFIMSKIKPLKLSDDNEDFALPKEVDPSDDHLSAKGLAFEDLEAYQLSKIERVILQNYPDGSVKYTYTDDLVTLVEFFITASQFTANRIASITMAYDSEEKVTSETYRIYDSSDGTTVVRTVTRTYTYSGDEIESYTEVTT